MTGVDFSVAPQLAGLLVAIVLYAAVAVFAAVFHRHKTALAAVYSVCIVAAAVAAGADLAALIADTDAGFRLPLGLPVIGLHIKLDALSAFFGLIVNLGVLTTSIYGLGLDRDRDLSARVEPFFPAYALAMNLVLIAGDAFGFLFSWELMSLTSWVLVVSRHRDADNRHAGHVYLVMAAIGTASLLFAFGGLAGAAGNYAFDAIRAAPPGPLVAGLVLAGAIFGAGSKAGIAPLHAWLPLAHPAAPSHVSALMSGVMTKVAIYGVIRIVFDLLGTPVWWWALPFLLLGATTAVLGLLYAVLDNDLKRVLAYSTVENIGIIFVGLGAGLQSLRASRCSCRGDDGNATPLSQSFMVQVAALSRRGRRTPWYGPARFRRAWRVNSPHAGHGCLLAGWRHVDLCPAAIQWVCFRVAAVSSRACGAGISRTHSALHVACGRRHAGPGRGPCRCLFRARLRHCLSWPSTQQGGRRSP
jgi:NADH:ubiquinone oxidoreductase subunit 5 (subunit L)/multisubunit Na+/H+ antiporter MnhA subunit